MKFILTDTGSGLDLFENYDYNTASVTQLGNVNWKNGFNWVIENTDRSVIVDANSNKFRSLTCTNLDSDTNAKIILDLAYPQTYDCELNLSDLASGNYKILAKISDKTDNNSCLHPVQSNASLYDNSLNCLIQNDYNHILNLYENGNNSFVVDAVSLVDGRPNILVNINSPTPGFTTQRGAVQIEGEIKVLDQGNSLVNKNNIYKLNVCINKLIFGESVPSNLDRDNCQSKKVVNVSAGWFKDIVTFDKQGGEYYIFAYIDLVKDMENIWMVGTGTGAVSTYSNPKKVTYDTTDAFVSVNALTGYENLETNPALNTKQEIDAFLKGQISINDLRTIKIISNVTNGTNAVDLYWKKYPDNFTTLAQEYYTEDAINIASINDTKEKSVMWNPDNKKEIKQNYLPNGAKDAYQSCVENTCTWIYQYPYNFWTPNGQYEVGYKGYKNNQLYNTSKFVTVKTILAKEPKLLKVIKPNKELAKNTQGQYFEPMGEVGIYPNDVDGRFYTNKSSSLKLIGASDPGAEIVLTVTAKIAGGESVDKIYEAKSDAVTGVWTVSNVDLSNGEGEYNIVIQDKNNSYAKELSRQNKIILDQTLPKITKSELFSTSNLIQTNNYFRAQDNAKISFTANEKLNQASVANELQVQNNASLIDKNNNVYEGSFNVNRPQEGVYYTYIYLEDLAGNKVYYSNDSTLNDASNRFVQTIYKDKERSPSATGNSDLINISDIINDNFNNSNFINRYLAIPSQKYVGLSSDKLVVMSNPNGNTKVVTNVPYKLQKDQTYKLTSVCNTIVGQICKMEIQDNFGEILGSQILVGTGSEIDMGLSFVAKNDYQNAKVVYYNITPGGENVYFDNLKLVKTSYCQSLQVCDGDLGQGNLSQWILSGNESIFVDNDSTRGNTIKVTKDTGNSDIYQQIKGNFKGGKTYRLSAECKSTTQCQIFFGDANTITGPAYQNQTSKAVTGSGFWQTIYVDLSLKNDESLNVYLYAKTGDAYYDNIQITEVGNQTINTPSNKFNTSNQYMVLKDYLIPREYINPVTNDFRLRIDNTPPIRQDFILDNIDLQTLSYQNLQNQIAKDKGETAKINFTTLDSIYTYNGIGLDCVENAICNNDFNLNTVLNGTNFKPQGWITNGNEYIVTDNSDGQFYNNIIQVNKDANNSDISQSITGVFKKDHTYRLSAMCKAGITSTCQMFIGDTNTMYGNSYENTSFVSLPGDSATSWKKLTTDITLKNDEKLDLYLYGRDGTAYYDKVMIRDVTNGIISDINSTIYGDKIDGVFADTNSTETDRLMSGDLQFTPDCTLKDSATLDKIYSGLTNCPQAVYSQKSNTLTFTAKAERNQRVHLEILDNTTNQTIISTSNSNHIQVTEKNCIVSTDPSSINTTNQTTNSQPIQITQTIGGKKDLELNQPIITRYKEECDFVYTIPLNTLNPNDQGQSPNGIPQFSYSISYYPIDKAGNEPTPQQVKTTTQTNTDTAQTTANNNTTTNNTTTVLTKTSGTVIVYHDNTPPTNNSYLLPYITNKSTENLQIQGEQQSDIEYKSNFLGQPQDKYPNTNQQNTTLEDYTKQTTTNPNGITSQQNYTYYYTNTNPLSQNKTLQERAKQQPTQTNKFIPRFDATGNYNKTLTLGTTTPETRDDNNLTNCTKLTNSPTANRRIGICQDGIYQVQTQSTDTAGNTNIKTYVTTERDTVRPDKANLTLNKNSINYGLGETLGLSINGEGDTFADLTIKSTIGTNNQPININATNNTNTIQKSIYLPNNGTYNSTNFLGQNLTCGNVTYTVTIKLKDQAGNISEETTQTITTNDCPNCSGTITASGWISPLNHPQAVVTATYGSNYGGPNTEYNNHNGLDLGVGGNPNGTVPVVATRTGIVVEVGLSTIGYGNMIKLKHNDNSYTLYAHLSTLPTDQNNNLIQYNQTVIQGQQLGKMGSTGNSTGPHLHFEVRGTDDKTVNPQNYIFQGSGNVTNPTAYAIFCNASGGDYVDGAGTGGETYSKTYDDYGIVADSDVTSNSFELDLAKISDDDLDLTTEISTAGSKILGDIVSLSNDFSTVVSVGEISCNIKWGQRPTCSASIPGIQDRIGAVMRIIEWLKNILEGLMNGLIEKAGSLYEKVKIFFDKLLSDFTALVKDLIVNSITSLKENYDALKKAIEDPLSIVKSLLGDMDEWNNTNSLGRAKIIGYATAGLIISSLTEFLDKPNPTILNVVSSIVKALTTKTSKLLSTVTNTAKLAGKKLKIAGQKTLKLLPNNQLGLSGYDTLDLVKNLDENSLKNLVTKIPGTQCSLVSLVSATNLQTQQYYTTEDGRQIPIIQTNNTVAKPGVTNQITTTELTTGKLSKPCLVNQARNAELYKMSHISKNYSNLATQKLNNNTGSSSDLRYNLKSIGVGEPADSAAHHIIPAGAYSQYSKLKDAKDKLAQYGININEASNGVFLPKNLSVSCDGVCTHSTLHTEKYINGVADRIIKSDINTGDKIREELDKIRNELLNGTVKY